MKRVAAKAAKRKPCPYCGRRGQNLRCGTHVLRTPHGDFMQYSFLNDDGSLRTRFVLVRKPSVLQSTQPLPPPPPPPKPENEYEHTPGKCALCGKRLRNPERVFHRRCHEQVLNPPPPPATKFLYEAKAFPPPTYCPQCRSVDNSFYAGATCRSCGKETTDLPDYLKPKPSSLAPAKKVRIRATDK